MVCRQITHFTIAFAIECHLNGFSISFNLKRVIFSQAIFFVVYFKTAKQHLVVPAIYVYQIDDLFQKFMNYACNSNQTFLFYHPLNGYENSTVNIEPNFHAEISETFKIDEEYCFRGKIVKYFNDYADAIAYKNHLRPIDPPVFNANRLIEQPIPLTEPFPQEIEQVFVQEAGTIANAHSPQENNESIQIKQEPELLIMNPIDEMEFDRILQGGGEDTAVQDISDGMFNFSLEETANSTDESEEDTFEPEGATCEPTQETASVLTESDEIVFEQVCSFPKPMICTEDVLSKHKDDPISGDLSYASKKNGDRIFMVGGAKIILSKSILDKIRAWATPPFHQKMDIDKSLVQLLLVKLVGMANLAIHDVSDNVKQFVYEFLRSRVGIEVSERIDYLENHIEEICVHYSK